MHRAANVLHRRRAACTASVSECRDQTSAICLPHLNSPSWTKIPQIRVDCGVILHGPWRRAKHLAATPPASSSATTAACSAPCMTPHSMPCPPWLCTSDTPCRILRSSRRQYPRLLAALRPTAPVKYPDATPRPCWSAESVECFACGATSSTTHCPPWRPTCGACSRANREPRPVPAQPPRSQDLGPAIAHGPIRDPDEAVRRPLQQ